MESTRNLPPWLAAILKQHPESLIEIPTLWRGRENNMISDADKTLRCKIKSFAQSHEDCVINIATFRPLMRRYLARCLMHSHLPDPDFQHLTPISQDISRSIGLPQEMIDTILTINAAPVFGQHS